MLGFSAHRFGAPSTAAPHHHLHRRHCPARSDRADAVPPPNQDSVRQRHLEIQSQGGSKRSSRSRSRATALSRCRNGSTCSGRRRQPGGHRMPSMPQQMFPALAQGGRQIEPVDAPPRPTPFWAITAQDNRGPIELPHNPRRHDPNHAHMPVLLALDNHVIARRIEPRANRATASSAMPAPTAAARDFAASSCAPVPSAFPGSRVSSSSSASVAVSSRPAAFKRGANWNATSKTPGGARVPATAFKCHAAPAAGCGQVLPNPPRPGSGSHLAMAPDPPPSPTPPDRAHPHIAGLRLRPPQPPPSLTSACASLNASPAEQRSTPAAPPPPDAEGLPAQVPVAQFLPN
jgi:hypothetical protein